jgi:redox-sensitive bicupin YhaK (pirin superfamily)
MRIRRLLPSRERQRVGPFIFLDHFGPEDLPRGTGGDVPPHPHIGLATVTYLFEGELLHRDSLGSSETIRPGEINWMHAGRGIVHSERTPAGLREAGSRIHGLQLWVALPSDLETTAPDFRH